MPPTSVGHRTSKPGVSGLYRCSYTLSRVGLPRRLPPNPLPWTPPSQQSALLPLVATAPLLPPPSSSVVFSVKLPHVSSVVPPSFGSPPLSAAALLAKALCSIALLLSSVSPSSSSSTLEFHTEPPSRTFKLWSEARQSIHPKPLASSLFLVNFISAHQLPSFSSRQPLVVEASSANPIFGLNRELLFIFNHGL